MNWTRSVIKLQSLDQPLAVYLLMAESLCTTAPVQYTVWKQFNLEQWQQIV
jgi:hypothetical protein